MKARPQSRAFSFSPASGWHCRLRAAMERHLPGGRSAGGSPAECSRLLSKLEATTTGLWRPRRRLYSVEKACIFLSAEGASVQEDRGRWEMKQQCVDPV